MTCIVRNNGNNNINTSNSNYNIQTFHKINKTKTTQQKIIIILEAAQGVRLIVILAFLVTIRAILFPKRRACLVVLQTTIDQPLLIKNWDQSQLQIIALCLLCQAILANRTHSKHVVQMCPQVAPQQPKEFLHHSNPMLCLTSHRRSSTILTLIYPNPIKLLMECLVIFLRVSCLLLKAQQSRNNH